MRYIVKLVKEHSLCGLRHPPLRDVLWPPHSSGESHVPLSGVSCGPLSGVSWGPLRDVSGSLLSGVFCEPPSLLRGVFSCYCINAVICYGEIVE